MPLPQTSHLKGIIFDFDGIILETEVPRFKAWRSLFQEHGFSFTVEQWHQGVGTGPSAFDPAELLVVLTNGRTEACKLQLLADERALELVRKQPILPGVQELIQAAKSAGLKLAVASSSTREWVLGNLDRIGLLTQLDAVCTADDVMRVKPDPELYLLAILKLGLSAQACLAFEDSPNGILAAKRAGVKCMAVPNEMTACMDLTAADGQFASISEFNLADFLLIMPHE